MLITVYWEDQRGVQPKSFGPHALLLACLEDDSGCDRVQLGELVQAIPKKGDSKLLTALAHDAKRVRDAGPIVVVFDNDRVRRLLELDHGACKRVVIETVTNACPVDLSVVLLEDNVEDLLNACLRAVGAPELQSKPNPNDRDTICQRVARATREARDKVRREAPSFDRLVRYVKDCLPTN